MAVSARTRTLLTWLPAGILVVVIGAVVFGAFAIQGSWWTEETPTASADQKASDGSSMLTDAGFDYVNVEGTLRVRIGEGGLSAQELGLPVDGEKSAEFRRPVKAVIAAGDEVYVLDDVSSLTATSADGRLVSVSLSPDVVSGWSGAVATLRALAPQFGWDAAQLATVDSDLAAFNRDGTAPTFTVTIGPSEGPAQITGELVFDRASGQAPVTITFAEPAAGLEPATP